MPGEEETRVRRLLAIPFNVVVPTIVCAVLEAKVNVAAVVTDLVRLLKVVEPEIVWAVPSSVTVPEL